MKKFLKDLIRRLLSRAFWGMGVAVVMFLMEPEAFTGTNLQVVIIAFMMYNAADTLIKSRGNGSN